MLIRDVGDGITSQRLAMAVAQDVLVVRTHEYGTQVV